MEHQAGPRRHGSHDDGDTARLRDPTAAEARAEPEQPEPESGAGMEQRGDPGGGVREALADLARGGPEAAALREWAFARLPIPVAVCDRSARIVAVNDELTRIVGQPEGELIGRGLSAVEFGSAKVDGIEELGRRALDKGEALRRPVRLTDSQDTTWSAVLVPLRDRSDQVKGLSAAFLNITREFRARRRLALVNEASARIGSTLDLFRTAQELVDIGTREIADFGTVDLLDAVLRGAEGDPAPQAGPLFFRRVAQQSVLEGCPESVVPTGDLHHYHLDSPADKALRTGRSARWSSDSAPFRSWLADSPARARATRKYGIHSIMVVPLLARGVTLGLLLLFRHRTQTPFDDDDLLLCDEIAARAAVCVDNARRYERERSAAITLQHHLLPRRTSKQSAVQAAFRYLPASSYEGMGGDWFDVIPLSGARVALVVGDVAGYGIYASATMGQLRTAVQTLADIDMPPDELLTHLDDLVMRLEWDDRPGPGGVDQAPSIPVELGARCLYAVYDPVSGICSLARAGHPSPALVTPDGQVRVLDLPAGPPLGLGGLPFESAEVRIAEGSVLALYTDGLLRAADPDIDVGLDLMSGALSRSRGPLEEVADDVLEVMLRRQPTDDVALVLARSRILAADDVADWELSADPAEVATARELTLGQLAAWGLEEKSFTTELIVSELVTNAVRYGGGPIRLRLIRDAVLICEVSDTNSTAPRMRRARVLDEGGRGLLLVAQIAHRWGSRPTDSGKVIWAEETLPVA